MCKRYYVEVSGLGEDGVEKIIAAGIKKSSILVIDDNNLLQPLINAILSATGITFEQICGQDRSRNVMVARLIYVHYATVVGQDRLKIMADINKNKTMYNWYQDHYDSSLQYDRQFKRAVDAVKQTLDADPTWQPTRLEKMKRKRKKRRGMKRKQKKAHIEQNTQNEGTEKMQLKIDFK